MTLTITEVLAFSAVLVAAIGIAWGVVNSLSRRIDATRTEMLSRMEAMRAENAEAHAGIVSRVEKIGNDVARLVGRQEERDAAVPGGGGAGRPGPGG